MEGARAREATAASQDLVDELAQPANKDGFYCAIVDFATAAVVQNELQKATELSGKVSGISASGSTNITAGCEIALRVLDSAEANVMPGATYLRPVVILFTDGGHNAGTLPHDVANLVQSKADLVTVAIGSGAAEGLFRELASTPQHFYRCENGRQLRGFLAAVGATMAGTMAAGTNATQALTSIQR